MGSFLDALINLLVALGERLAGRRLMFLDGWSALPAARPPRPTGHEVGWTEFTSLEAPDPCPYWVPDMDDPTVCAYCADPKDEHTERALATG